MPACKFVYENKIKQIEQYSIIKTSVTITKLRLQGSIQQNDLAFRTIVLTCLDADITIAVTKQNIH